MSANSPVYDDDLLREIADFNARYAQTVNSPDTAPILNGGLPDDDPDVIDWYRRHNPATVEEHDER